MPVGVGLAAAVIGVVFGSVFAAPPRVKLATGESELVTFDGDAVAMNGTSYAIGTGLSWRGTDGVWHDGGQPECLPPLSHGARVEIATTNVKPGHGGPGFPQHVVWVRCVTLPDVVQDASGWPVPPLDAAYRKALERD